jgi:hypothetical protein
MRKGFWARSGLLFLRFGRLRDAPRGQTPTRSASESSPSPTSNGGRPSLLLEDTAETDGGGRAQRCFACESGRLGRSEVVTAGRSPTRK